MNNNPIGVLDSGLGGLTVWQEIVKLLPHESVVYIADSKNTPYGEKSPDEIFHLAKKNIEFLLKKKAKIIVTACNSITVSCVDRLRETFPEIPIIGTVPAVKPAAAKTQNKRIGILATTRTIESDYQTNLINQFASDCKVFKHGTDELVPLIEKGEMKGEKMTQALNRILPFFKEEGVDCLVLGCTHFPFLRDQIQQILGPNVLLIDSGEAIAKGTQWILEQKKTLAEDTQIPEYSFYTTGDPTIAKKILIGTIAEEKEFKRISL